VHRPLATAGLVAALVVALCAACGGSESSSSTTQATTTTSTGGSGTGTGISVGLVTDVGGLNDRSFNFLANQGLQRAESQLGVRGRVLSSKSGGDYVPNLSTLAQQHYDLVIGVGFPMAKAMEQVANRFPDVRFAIIDSSQAAMKTKPQNVRGLLFEEQEAGYLVGYLAGLLERQQAGAKQTISSVGGQKIPPVDRYLAGYRAGALKADPGITVLNAYSQDFVDQAKCKELALDQIARGSDTVFAAARQCGLGALAAAGEKNAWGIGVDADRSYLGPHILTSAVKKVDAAVFQTIQQAQAGGFTGGEDAVFDLASGGVGIGKVSARVPADIVQRVTALEDQIAAGTVTDIPTTLP